MTPTAEKKTKRPPVIAVMGHIDHGKSTLLDYIRRTNTTEKEVGGITQRIGAYQAIFTDKNGVAHPLTFIDTPGHEAFGSIRTRAAAAADLAIVVISGEDGVKPQTLEALKIIRTKKIPFVVAINKMDRPSADIERTKASLSEHEVYVEGYGGDIPFAPISALKGDGVAELLEILVLMAELEGLTADPTQKAEGVIIEAHMDAKKGTTATLIIKNGTLHIGDVALSQDSFSPVRNIEDSTGKSLKTADAGTPVRIIGWNKLPTVGSRFATVNSRKEAETLAVKASTRKPALVAAEPLENTSIVPIVIKADTVGVLDAIKHEIEKIKLEGVLVKTLVEGVGSISESDLKTVSGATAPLVIGFNVKIDASAKALAERLKIPVVTFDIIYRLTEWIDGELQKRKPRIEVEEETGTAKILKLFNSEKGRFVVGAKVEAGLLKNGSDFKILRRGSEVGRGKIKSLQQLKSKVDEVGKDKEFGAQIESKIEPAPGDRMHTFETILK